MSAAPTPIAEPPISGPVPRDGARAGCRPPGALIEISRLLWRHRRLTWELSKREITDRYAGQVLGTLWAVGHPIVQLAVYVFIFAYVFKLRIGGTLELPLDYTTYLLAGMIPWLACSESMSKGALAVTGNAGLIKQVVFPIEVLPVKAVLSSMVTQSIATVLLTIYVLISHGYVPWTYALLPALWVMQLMLMSGLAFALSAIGAYVRDVKDVLQAYLAIGMFLMPVLYLPQHVPEAFRPILYANPFSYLTWCYQDVCFFGRFEHPWAWGVAALLAVGMLGVGYRVFRKLKIGFGSIL